MLHAPPPYGQALGLIETRSIARGVVVCDALVKRAAVRLLQTEPLTPGKYVILFDGSEAEVDESMLAGLEAAGDSLVDHLLLHQPAPALWAALSSAVARPVLDSIGVVETLTIASTLAACDAAMKAAHVELVQMHLARGIDGKGFFVITGSLDSVEAAVEAAASRCADGLVVGQEIVARPHEDLDGTAV